jgi:glycosyltransferase involved in cell wall biosynthesis
MFRYLIVSDDNPASGVLKKARYQVDALNALGMKAELVIVTQEAGNPEVSGPVHIVQYHKPAKKTLGARLQRANEIRHIISDQITSLGPGDILYYRAFGSMMLSYFPLTFLRPFRKCRIISEHNSIEVRELRLEGNYLAVIRNLIAGNFIIGQSDGIVGVTEEITRYWTRRFFYRAIPHVTIPNGFSVGSVPVRNPPPGPSQDLHILFVGNVSRWHGLDRIMAGMADYAGPVQIHLHIIGDGDELENLKKLADRLAITSAVHFHGFLGGSDLDPLFDRYHIAIGSLGIHRNGMEQASALKVREYCARGIPCMISNTDPDFPDTFACCLHLAADETPVPVETVLAFAHATFSDPEHPRIMRAYAQEHLDWSIKMRDLKNFIQHFSG